MTADPFCLGSPFLASEDGVLGGVIVLRSCRCSTEPDSSQNKQTLLGKLDMSMLCFFSPLVLRNEKFYYLKSVTLWHGRDGYTINIYISLFFLHSYLLHHFQVGLEPRTLVQSLGMSDLIPQSF